MSEVSDYWKPQLIKTEHERDTAQLKLGSILSALKDYHHALDNRDHGGIAADKAINRIQQILGAPWVMGKEKSERDTKRA